MGVLSGRRVERGEERSPCSGEVQPAGVGIFSDQEHKTQDGQERTLSVRQQQEIQEVLRRMNDIHYAYLICQHFP